jgi:hypothetical protein
MSDYSSSCSTFSAACTNIHIFNAAITTEYHSCPTPLQANATNFTMLTTTAGISAWGYRTKDYLLTTLISYFNQYLNCKLEVQAATGKTHNFFYWFELYFTPTTVVPACQITA